MKLGAVDELITQPDEDHLIQVGEAIEDGAPDMGYTSWEIIRLIM